MSTNRSQLLLHPSVVFKAVSVELHRRTLCRRVGAGTRTLCNRQKQDHTGGTRHRSRVRNLLENQDHGFQEMQAGTGQLLHLSGVQSVPLQQRLFVALRGNIHTRVSTHNNEFQQNVYLRGGTGVSGCTVERIPDATIRIRVARNPTTTRPGRDFSTLRGKSRQVISFHLDPHTGTHQRGMYRTGANLVRGEVSANPEGTASSTACCHLL